MHCQWGRKPLKLPIPLGLCHPAREGPSHGHRQMHKKLVKIARVVREICSWTDRHTDTHTDRHTHYNTSSQPPWPTEYADGTDRQTDGCQTITLYFLLDAASIIINNYQARTKLFRRLVAFYWFIKVFMTYVRY